MIVDRNLGTAFSLMRWWRDTVAMVLVLGISFVAGVGVATAQEASIAGALSSNLFVNPIGEGADPWVTRDPLSGGYLWCFSEGNRELAIHKSPSLTSLGEKHIVWTAPPFGPFSKELWAPELHFLDEHWHIYFAASDGNNENHKTYVLRSATADVLSEYELIGPLKTGAGSDRDSPNLWSIDMTVLEYDQRRYAIWSGWDAPKTDQQYLYIAEMKSPTELVGPRVRICNHDDFQWERIESNATAKGLNEGPQVFQSGDATAIVYSCGASWMPNYKLGMLELRGDDPLNSESWKKRPDPVFESSESTYGVGHSCFVRSLDDKQWWHVFHAKRDREPGWRRAIFVQPMNVDEQGFPVFGKPVATGSILHRPSGESSSEKSPKTDGFSYYGHHQFYAATKDEIQLGARPGVPINEYRSGEKVVFNRAVADDAEISVVIDFQGQTQSRDAGILFRCSAVSIGYDAQRGYFAGLVPKTSLLVVGKMDGKKWTELARVDCTFDPSIPQRLAVRIVGDEIAVVHNDTVKLKVQDDQYRSGKAGLRVVDTDATFREWSFKSL
ncbi:Extracellular exo-alpha-(1-_5)-L-arabinofuranosidase precursor [Rubripirellula reticaptiva]|uniref:Extracellular exo-alpha-(1->5)-L-arabinofuranosidase n=2 Tax=Rubripirellula reticaptiva TaxID=2528013 RepID=A0A5C6EJ94_9BACT|nr:Extracellular exo-alpha-(1->5)-L-arabinofuranosidase precursor [Rubripirellula reticaptiva]